MPATFLSKIGNLAKRRGMKGPKELLEHLYNEEHRSPFEIAEEYGTDSRTVRFLLDAFGVQARTMEPVIVRRVRDRKFKSVYEYFLARSTASLLSMEGELGVDASTIASYYDIYVREMGGATGLQPKVEPARAKRPARKR